MIKIAASTLLPIKQWEFMFSVISWSEDKKEHLVISKWLDSLSEEMVPVVRVHSECITWDLFWSQRCDCWKQFQDSLNLIEKEGVWLLIYLRQEWRWIWLIEKIKAYNLQDNWLDTVEANERLGFKPDNRDYKIAADILKLLGIKTLRLISNNPEKSRALEKYWIKVSEIIYIKACTNKWNRQYLEVKARKLGHEIEL